MRSLLYEVKKMRHYGHRFRVLHWICSQMLNEPSSQMGLTASQGRFIGFIANAKEPPCPKDLEDYFQLSHPSISGVLKRLEQKEFIEFRSDPKDGRSKRIYLLPKGIECHERVLNQIQRIEQTVVSGFTAEEEELFSQFLDRAVINLSGKSCRCTEKKEDS